MAPKKWSKDELIAAFNLYCKAPFSKINAQNKEVRKLAPVIGRSASAVSLKLANFARLDPDLKKRNITGMQHRSKGEIEIWEEFNQNWEALAWKSELILARMKNTSVEKQFKSEKITKKGKERLTVVKQRVNQSFFRKTILASYDGKCCITGIDVPDLLVASHIKPWAVDSENRMNPCNGLCLNALHDKAFDSGLITITPDYKIVISDELSGSSNTGIKIFISVFEKKEIMLPQKFYPDPEFLRYHNYSVFRGTV